MADPIGWQPWPGLAAEVWPHLACLPWTDIAAAPRGPGLPAGERALAAAAVARLLGCPYLAAVEAGHATLALRRPREVRVLIEEGLPSPLTGRLGAVVTAAGALGRSPPLLSGRDIWRLEEERLDDQEIVDLIVTAAVAGWTARLTLGLGQPVAP